MTTVGGMGSPTVGIERVGRGDECVRAMRALERHMGRRFTHVIPGEIGGSNSMRPMIVAAQTGLPVIDGDGMGRAFPELQMDTFSIYGVAPTPGTLADPRGHEVIFDRIADPVTLERYARAVTIQMGGAAGYAFPPMTAEEVRRTAIPGTVTLAIEIGRAVLAARAALANPVDAALVGCGRAAALSRQDRRRRAAVARRVRARRAPARRVRPGRRRDAADRLPEREPHRPHRTTARSWPSCPT